MIYGGEHSEESKKKISKTKTSSGIFRVSKQKYNYKNGFIWFYRYPENNKIKKIYSHDLLELKEKVLDKGLEWLIIDEAKVNKSIREGV